MTCPSELILAQYADGELAPQEVVATDTHLATCQSCRARLGALRAEVALVSAALSHLPESGAVPAFERPASSGVIAASAALLLIVTGLISATPTLLGFSVPAPLAWLDPFDPARLVDVAIRVALFLAEHGDAIMTSITETVAAVVIMCLVAWLAFALRKRFPRASLVACLACAVAVMPTPSQALEIRHVEDGDVLIAADETITDTLIAAGDTVEVDGNVEGDLIAVGRRVVIRGRVGGQLVTAASTITLDGDIGGSVLSMGKSLEVSSNRIGRNLFGFGETITLSDRASIEQNAIVFAQRANFAGPVGRDVIGFGEEIEVGSTIGGALTAYSERVTLLAPARVAGKLTAHVPQEVRLTISPGAVVGGEIATEVHEPRDDGKDYTSGDFWMFQLLRFAGGFLTGVVVLTLVPGLRGASLDSARSAFVAAGLGLLVLVAAPIIAVLVAITIIGIPIAFFAFMLWLAGLYLAKVVLAHFIGARLIEASGNRRHFTAALAAGLLLVIVVVNVPFIGPLLNFLLTITGLGLLMLFVSRARWRGAEHG